MLEERRVAKYSTAYEIDCANAILELRHFGASSVARGLADLIDHTWDEDDAERKAEKQQAIRATLDLAKLFEKLGA